MSDRADDDALTWDGDDDPTLTTGRDADRSAPRTPARSAAAAPDRRPAESAGAHAPAEEDGSSGLGNAALVGMGVLGGVYLLFAVGWLVGAQRLVGRAPYLLGDVMFQGSAWLAAAAPLLWFAAVLVFTRGQRAWVRFVWLIAGAVLLVPWPFAMVGTFG